MSDFITELTINRVPCRMRIRGAQEETYYIKIKICDYTDFPVSSGLTVFSEGFLAELAEIANRNAWNTAGPFDPIFRQNLIGTIELNYHRETHSGYSDPEEPDAVMRMLVDHYVEPIIDDLVKEGFPKDAVPVFRQFAREDFAFSIGLTIGQFWDQVKKVMTD